MKTKILPPAIFAMLSFYAVNSYAQANTALSNLTSPTAVNVNLLPDKNNKHDLGSASKAWGNLYLGNSIFFGGSRFISSTYGSATGNTGVGVGVLNSNTTGDFNTACGYQSLYSNSKGIWNTAYGYQSLYSDTTGNENTAIGFQSLFFNQGYWNTAVGYGSLYSNTIGAYNTGSGEYALYS